MKITIAIIAVILILLFVAVIARHTPQDSATYQNNNTAVTQPDSVTRFIAVGDSRGSTSGINVTILSEMVQAVLAENVDFIVFPGDLIYGSSDSATLQSELMQWQTVVQPLYDAGIGVYPCRGNHDAHNKNVWDIVFSGQYALPGNGPNGEENVTFSVIKNNVMAIGVDEYVTSHRVNQTWLDSLFTVNMVPHVFIFGHEPAFKVRHWDCLDDYPDDRNTFWNSLAAEGGRVYFCGHDHFYDHVRLDDGDGDTTNDVHQVLVGTAGAPLRSDDSYNGNNGSWMPQRVHHEQEYGYVLVEVTGLDVTLTWKHRVAAGVYEPGGDTWSYSVAIDSCCVDLRGNIDGDPTDEILVTDLSYLVDFLFQGGPPPPCTDEGNIDGITNAGGPIDEADLLYLIAYLFQNGPLPVACP